MSTKVEQLSESMIFLTGSVLACLVACVLLGRRVEDIEKRTDDLTDRQRSHGKKLHPLWSGLDHPTVDEVLADAEPEDLAGRETDQGMMPTADPPGRRARKSALTKPVRPHDS